MTYLYLCTKASILPQVSDSEDFRMLGQKEIGIVLLVFLQLSEKSGEGREISGR